MKTNHMHVVLQGTNDLRRLKRWDRQYASQFRRRKSKGWRRHLRGQKARVH